MFVKVATVALVGSLVFSMNVFAQQNRAPNITDPKTGTVYRNTGLSNQGRWDRCLSEGGRPYVDQSRCRANPAVPGDRQCLVIYQGCPVVEAEAKQ
ncbi:MAG TPA: hypothetical protein VG984_00300 [Candidatus Paceibacterota bacterium]|nr:hypothetical protein [Candidatus Paceibacterota bacterium]